MTELRTCLFGASADTGNLGVSALCESVVDGIARRAPAADVTVFDNGWGIRPATLPGVDGAADFAYRLQGARLSRYVHRPESLHQMLAASYVGGRGNAGTGVMARSDAVLDISGGDSFTDLYGPRRWQMVEMPKRIALRLGRPLVLLPQTYGPFSGDEVRRAAAGIVRRSARAWARDERSHAALRELVGADYDPERHRAGVDVAFGLVPRPPVSPLPAPLGDWLAPGHDVPVAGLNVSGLLYNDPGAAGRFGLRCDYREAVTGIVRRLLAEPDVRVVLVPHVVVPEGVIESDVSAARELADAVGRPDRVVVAPAPPGPGQAKWLVSRLDWLCATRMHATIAALSSTVPVSAVAYSLKVQGVFETCGVGDQVADARSLGTADLVDAVLASWEARHAVAERLAASVPGVLDRAAAQMDDIVAACTGRPAPAGVGNP